MQGTRGWRRRCQLEGFCQGLGGSKDLNLAKAKLWRQELCKA